MMTSSEKIRMLAKRKDMNLVDIAEKTGQSRQNLSNKMNRDDWKESELRAVAEAMGYQIKVVFVDMETGEEH